MMLAAYFTATADCAVDIVELCFNCLTQEYQIQGYKKAIMSWGEACQKMRLRVGSIIKL